MHESNLKRIGDFVPTRSTVGTKIDKSTKGNIKKARKIRTPNRKDELWYKAFYKCKETWPKKSGELTTTLFAIRTFSLKTEEDWSHIISSCDQEEIRGVPWTKVFWGSIKIKK